MSDADESVEKRGRDVGTLGVHGDRPADADTDHLGFEPFVTALKQYLLDPATEPPIVASVEGEWGTGKSSFIQMLQDELDEEGQITVEFDPWRHESEDALWAAFALEFVRQVREEYGLRGQIRRGASLRWKRFWKKNSPVKIVRAFLSAFVLLTAAAVGLWIGADAVSPSVTSPLTSQLLPTLRDGDTLSYVLGSSGLVVTAFSALQIWGRVKSVLRNPVDDDIRQSVTGPDYEQRVSFVSEFQEDLQRIVKTYAPSEERNVFVFIDDLDRCEVPKAAELMQAINLMLGSDPNVFFVLALDRENVAAGITAKHDELLPYLSGDTDERSGEATRPREDIEFGYRYLEKFIQLPLTIPEPDTDDMVAFVEHLTQTDRRDSRSSNRESADERSNRVSPESLAELKRETLSEVTEMVAPALDHNPRKMKKFLNLYELRTRLANENGLITYRDGDFSADGYSTYHLAKFIAIGLRWPRLLPELSANRWLLSELQQFADADDIDPSDVPDDRPIKTWTAKVELIELLQFGTDGDRSAAAHAYSFENKRVDKLLQISPRVDQPTKTTTSKSWAFEQKREGHVWVFNIDRNNWPQCVAGPPEGLADVHGEENVGEPWYGLRVNSTVDSDELERGDLVVVRRSRDGVVGIWKFYDASAVNSQDEVAWGDASYETVLYCRPIVRQFDAPLDETFIDSADLLKISGNVRDLSPDIAHSYVTNLAEELRERGYPRTTIEVLEEYESQVSSRQTPDSTGDADRSPSLSTDD